MSFRTCPACSKEYRAAGRLVMLLNPCGEESDRTARVCPKCAARGVIVVAAQQAPVFKSEAMPAAHLFDSAIRKLTAYARAAEAGSARDVSSEIRFIAQGRIEGYEAAIGLLRKLQKGEGL